MEPKKFFQRIIQRYTTKFYIILSFPKIFCSSTLYIIFELYYIFSLENVDILILYNLKVPNGSGPLWVDKTYLKIVLCHANPCKPNSWPNTDHELMGQSCRYAMLGAILVGHVNRLCRWACWYVIHFIKIFNLLFEVILS